MRRCLLAAFLFAHAVAAFCNVTTGDLLVAPIPPPGPPGGIPIPFLVLDADGVQQGTFGLGHEVVTNGGAIFTTPGFTAYNLALQQTGTAPPPTFALVEAADSTGHAYVVVDASNPRIVNVYDTTGTLVRQITLPGLGFHMDLAPDNCTLFWIGPGQLIHRYDICNNTALTDPAPGQTAVFVRALTGGGFLAGRDLSLIFYDASGNAVRTITRPDFVFSAAFTPDGQAMWVASTGNLARIPLSGALPPLSVNVQAENVAVVSEQRPTLAQVLAPVTPAVSPLLLAALAVALIAIAFIRAG